MFTPIWGVASKKVSASSFEEAINQVCSWTVETAPVIVNGEPYKGLKAFVRSDNKRVLGVVGSRTRPFQNYEIFRFLNDFLDRMSIEYVGITHGGARIFVLCSLNKTDTVIGDDVVNRYLLFTNSHDGSQAIRIGFTPIRVFCSNMLKTAYESGVFVSVKHNGDYQRLNKVRDAIESDVFDKTLEAYQMLASKNITSDKLNEYFSHFPKKQKLMEYFEQSNGDSYWTAYNAVNTLLNHNKQNEKRLTSLLWGNYNKLDRLAFDKAIEMAQAV
ncbi:MAG: DUF932 domain-containing protein [Endomicrobiia bacterium]